jgi:hypothetical protein
VRRLVKLRETPPEVAIQPVEKEAHMHSIPLHNPFKTTKARVSEEATKENTTVSFNHLSWEDFTDGGPVLSETPIIGMRVRTYGEHVMGLLWSQSELAVS